jgi:tetratricopeptide (TPR) repeat protein
VLGGGGLVARKTVVPRIAQALGSQANSTIFRAYTWKGTVHMIAARPVLGFGPAAFPSAYPRFAQTGFTRSAHQVWLQLAAESGVPALLLLFGAWGLGWVAAWRALKTPHWPLAAGLIAALTAFAVHGFTDAGWGITSIATLLLVMLAALDALAADGLAAGKDGQAITIEPTTISAKQPAARSNTRRSQLGFGWLAVSLALGGASYIAQRAADGESARAATKHALLQGATTVALQNGQAAVASDGLSSRTWGILAQAQQSASQDALASYLKITQLRPTNAPGWLDLAEYCTQRGLPAEAYFDRAVDCDPNDTTVRWARARFRLQRGDRRGWTDIEHIAASHEAPYGLYAATPERVDLNFARAFLKLGERAAQSGDSAGARRRLGQAADVLAAAHKYQAAQLAMAADMDGADSIAASPDELVELDGELKSLKERSK